MNNECSVGKQIFVFIRTNSTYAFSLNPPLTTIVQPTYEIGRVATQKMLELLEHPENKDFERVELDTQLVVRDSTM